MRGTEEAAHEESTNSESGASHSANEQAGIEILENFVDPGVTRHSNAFSKRTLENEDLAVTT